MKTCVICGAPLDTSNSDEHIIHNALGGVLKDNGIYCNHCNSTYGTCLDKEFTQIFEPIMACLRIHKDRRTGGSPYWGVVLGEDGKQYRAKFKGRKIMELHDESGHYINPNNMNCKLLSIDFRLDNNAFKLGLAKIAFNYAIHQGLDPGQLERVFDNEKKELVNNPVVIPFVPLTLFDAVMEQEPPGILFHALRIFNTGQLLYAYVELFGIFQHYVLLSECYCFEQMGCIDRSDGNIIEQKEMPDNQFLKDVTPNKYKDAMMLAQQYQIDLKEPMGRGRDSDADIFSSIGKLAYELVRKQPYLVSYGILVNKQYSKAEFDKYFTELDLIRSLVKFDYGNLKTEKDTEIAIRLLCDFKFYADCEDNRVIIRRYKRLLPCGSSYPLRICEILSKGQDLQDYGHMKFRNLLKNRA